MPVQPKAVRRSVVNLPDDVDECSLGVDGGEVHLTNLRKVFFPKLKLTKRDLLQYYAGVSRWLLPHLQSRAMVMKRYPNGIDSEFFFMKRTLQPTRRGFLPAPSNLGRETSSIFR
ncbi:MAG TPA: hypothetical protein VMP12_13320 [Candidatus Sulfotelmatobacter sp.]|nr:hypothetical protein [Candidatus Sulfotelmatobacter sp.]